MRAVILVDAAPGFEESVVATLGKTQGVLRTARVKHKNYDLAILVDAQDDADLQRFLSSRLRMISGVRGMEKVDNPPQDLMLKLS